MELELLDILPIVAVVISISVLIYLVRIHLQIKSALAYTDIAKEALTRSIDAHIALQAIKQSSHTVIPISQGEDIEKKMQEIMGLGNEDFERDLEKAGFNSETPDDLV